MCHYWIFSKRKKEVSAMKLKFKKYLQIGKKGSISQPIATLSNERKMYVPNKRKKEVSAAHTSFFRLLNIQ